MNLFIYLYNVFFILLFMGVAMTSATAYGITKVRWLTDLMVVMILVAAESLIEMGYGIASDFFATQIPQSIPSRLVFTLGHTVLYGAEAIFGFHLIDRALGRIRRVVAWALVAVMVVARLVTLAVQRSLASDIIYISANPVLVMAILGILYRALGSAQGVLPDAWADNIRKSLVVCLVLYAIAIGENITALAIPQATLGVPFYSERVNLFEDGAWVILAVVAFLVVRELGRQGMRKSVEDMAQRRMDEFQLKMREEHEEDERKDERARVREFCEYYRLTQREAEVLRLALKGKTNQEIASELTITVGTVKAHMHSIFSKLGVSHRSQLMNLFLQME